MMLYCIKVIPWQRVVWDWYLPWSYWRLLGTTKADTFTPVISAWVGRLGPLIQSLQRAKESLTQICLFLLSFCKWAWWHCGSCHCMHIFSYAEWVSQQVCIWSSHAYRQLFHKVVNCDHTKDMLFLLPLQPCNKNLVCKLYIQDLGVGRGSLEFWMDLNFLCGWWVLKYTTIELVDNSLHSFLVDN